MHQDEGHYAGKHPENTVPDKKARAAAEAYSERGRIGCAAAHKAAAEAGVSPAEMGRTLDLIEVRITECQLGLFGHGGKGRGEAESDLPAAADETAAEIREISAGSGISCFDLWRVAANRGCTRREAAAVCEDAGVKIRDCQLGAF